jgi:hypothetical protein
MNDISFTKEEIIRGLQEASLNSNVIQRRGLYRDEACLRLASFSPPTADF